MSATILAFSGSSRSASLNGKLLQYAVAGAREAGASVTVVRLADYELPIYDGDLEERDGLPAGARAFQDAVAHHDALLIASPEHNGGYTALLKNALDWLSRPMPGGRSGLDLVTGKAAAVISASPGILGGVRSQTALRIVLEKVGMIVIPQSLALGQAHLQFDEAQGGLKPSVAGAAQSVGAALANVATRLAV
ncbi:FMN reductase [Bordetella sp. H567]|uniref:NADPH-dependent FMN reductase n=1 Tax=Bordetella sp. H567 TaxID=1697043 RepID=UPI00081CB6FC|nr:NAD(P)H-dependent oxidoreductase [Bordetella sp. H567]AOB32777.1 FMN reductase [Bordetella sp. H567]